MADNKVNSGLLEFSEDQKVFVALDAETSEVKKAVTIDGDGVETDITGGGGGGVTVEALSVTENGTYSEEGKAYSPVTVNVAGAASDFSTAEVEVINTTADLVSVSAVSIRDTPSSAIAAFGTIMADSDRTYTAPLYKGVCTWKITAADAVVAVTGDISYDNGNVFITGDGTITIS